jgi:hypothetical protein
MMIVEKPMVGDLEQPRRQTASAITEAQQVNL